MTTKDAAHWRDKYLDLLDEQEADQRRHEQHVALLEKAILRVSLAAEGYDEKLDEHLSGLRDRLRQEGSHNLEPLFKPLEEQLLITDEQRTISQEKTRSALQNMMISLREVAPPGDLREELKYKTKAINQAAEQSASMADLLEELAEMQHQVLAGLGAAAEFTEDRVAGARDNVIDAEIAPETADGVEDAAAADSVEALEGQLQTREEVGRASALVQQAAVEAASLRGAELAADGIPKAIFPILDDLLKQLDPPADCVLQKALAVRKRLERGLQLEDLVPVLEDIRDLVMQAYLAADEEHRQYLSSVDEALKKIMSALGVALEDYQEQSQAEANFANQVSSNMASLSSLAASADSLDLLKQHVDQHLETLQEAVNSRAEGVAKVTSPISEQLSELVRQINAIEQEASQAKQDLEEQRKKAVTDSLTGLPNREAYVERAHYEYNRWQRYDRPLTLAVTDIDHFKRINDNYGHQAGDRVLEVLAKAIAKRLREVDFIGRYGGEEFVILLPETDEQSAHEALDKIRQAIAAMPFRFHKEPVTITMSIGLSQFREGDTVETVFERADKQLYVAKEQGRNRCLIAD
jgi:diguanylate cyclase